VVTLLLIKFQYIGVWIWIGLPCIHTYSCTKFNLPQTLRMQVLHKSGSACIQKLFIWNLHSSEMMKLVLYLDFRIINTIFSNNLFQVLFTNCSKGHQWSSLPSYPHLIILSNYLQVIMALKCNLRMYRF
jgi:hypothetical protein